MSDSDAGVLCSISTCAFLSSIVSVFSSVLMLIPSSLNYVTAIELFDAAIFRPAYFSAAMTLQTASSCVCRFLSVYITMSSMNALTILSHGSFVHSCFHLCGYSFSRACDVVLLKILFIRNAQ